MARFFTLDTTEKSRGASLGALQLYKIDSHSKPINEIQLIVCNLFITLHSLQYSFFFEGCDYKQGLVIFKLVLEALNQPRKHPCNKPSKSLYQLSHTISLILLCELLDE